MGNFAVTWTLQSERLLPPVLRTALVTAVDKDFEASDAETDWIHYIVMSSPGHWKMKPDIGVGIYKYLNSNISPDVVKRDIKEHLGKDIFKRPFVDTSKFPTVNVNDIIIEL